VAITSSNPSRSWLLWSCRIGARSIALLPSRWCVLEQLVALYNLHPRTDESLKDCSSRYLPWLGPIIWTNCSKVTSRNFQEPCLDNEMGTTPHADRQGYNVPSPTQAHQEWIQDFVSETMQRHALLSQTCYPHDPLLETGP